MATPALMLTPMRPGFLQDGGPTRDSQQWPQPHFVPTAPPVADRIEIMREGAVSPLITTVEYHQPPAGVKGEAQPLLTRNSSYSVSYYDDHLPPPQPAPRPVEPHPWQPTLVLKERPDKTNWCGILLAFMSGAFFTLSSAAVKWLRSIDPMELLVIRALLQVLVMLPLVACGGGGGQLLGPRGHRMLLQIQGVVGGLTLVLLFFSFRRLPLGDATTIIFSSPVLVMILSFALLKEPCGFFRTFIVFMLVTGVVLISKPPFLFQGSLSTPGEYDVIGYTCAIFATIFTALNIVVMRKCKEVHFSVVVLQLSMWTLMVSAAALLLFGHRHTLGALIHRTWWEWFMAVAVSVLGLTGQVLVAQALRIEGAGKVSVTRSLDIVLAFILQVFVFGEYPDWMSILGASLVLICVVGIGLEEQVYYIAGILP